MFVQIDKFVGPPCSQQLTIAIAQFHFITLLQNYYLVLPRDIN